MATLFAIYGIAYCQPSHFPLNGVRDERPVYYAFKNCTIFRPGGDTLKNAYLLIKGDRIEAIGQNITIPSGTVVYDLSGKFIYPSFIEPFTSYGMPAASKPERQASPQYTSERSGSYSWNEALKSEVDAYKLFSTQPDSGKNLRDAGFGTAISLVRDGVARGTATAVSLAPISVHQSIIKDKVAACYSLNKGTSTQDYPGSQMGAIALLRQAWYDSQWYEKGGKDLYNDISLEAWNSNKTLRQYFEVSDKQMALRAQKIGDEFNIKFIIKGAGDEYQRLAEIKKTGSTFIIPVNFPENYDLSDPYTSLNVSIGVLKHWELAPFNAYLLDSAGISFALTADGLKDPKEFIKQLRIINRTGFDRQKILQACTTIPARIFGIEKETGDLKKGMLANFIIVSGDLFDPESELMENWTAGKRNVLKDATTPDYNGMYTLFLGRLPGKQLLIEEKGPGNISAFMVHDSSRTAVTISISGKSIMLFVNDTISSNDDFYRLSGNMISQNPITFEGTGTNKKGQWFNWKAAWDSIPAVAENGEEKSETLERGTIWYPNKAYGRIAIPQQEQVIIRNATVWTNESDGVLKNTDVLIKAGKIQAIGQNLDTIGCRVLDGTGKHLTSGIIDEHSHIAITGGVNECTQSVTAEVRIGDVLNSEDLNIYRQLAGGVTAAQLLHGSCNPIGGQSGLIKLRWGVAPEKLKIAGASGFIKFALGENVKQSNWGDNYNSRYPQSRMGVEQIYYDAFWRAREYEHTWKNISKGSNTPRKDLELETLVEILSSKRFVTTHSYQQGEINMLMHVADSMGFKLNTFTHILEGYKVADKMKAHGVGASTFSDWWAYKYEVIEAIPYNGAIMDQMGIVVAYNSDDAEMARRLNQEAAKAIKYGGLSEEEAWKFVTLNPAKLLHLDDTMGSIKVGKDADVVLWNHNPLSVYAIPLYTFVDGICYYSKVDDDALKIQNENERARIIAKMMAKKESDKGSEQMATEDEPEVKHCINKEDLNP